MQNYLIIVASLFLLNSSALGAVPEYVYVTELNVNFRMTQNLPQPILVSPNGGGRYTVNRARFNTQLVLELFGLAQDPPVQFPRGTRLLYQTRIAEEAENNVFGYLIRHKDDIPDIEFTPYLSAENRFSIQTGSIRASGAGTLRLQSTAGLFFRTDAPALPADFSNSESPPSFADVIPLLSFHCREAIVNTRVAFQFQTPPQSDPRLMPIIVNASYQIFGPTVRRFTSNGSLTSGLASGRIIIGGLRRVGFQEVE